MELTISLMESNYLKEMFINDFGIDLRNDGKEPKWPEDQQECGRCFSANSIINRIFFLLRKKRCEGCRHELVRTEEEAESVADSCFSVLNNLYGINTGKRNEVKMCPWYSRKRFYLYKHNKLAEVEENEEVFTVYMAKAIPRIVIVIKILEICFRKELRAISGQEREKAERKAKEEEKEKKEKKEEKKGEWRESEKTEQKTETEVLVKWLVINCLYEMGEYEYAKQYQSDFMKEDKEEAFQAFTDRIGKPFSTYAMKLEDLLKAD